MSGSSCTPFLFDLNKYLGTWYELAHYPSWFQRNDNYNTKAKYSINNDGTINVKNSTISNGKKFISRGNAIKLTSTNFNVQFDKSEINNLINSSEFNSPNINLSQYPNETTFQDNVIDQSQNDIVDRSDANYVIDKIWMNAKNEYIFAVVTNSTKDSFYLLSRSRTPLLNSYNIVMEYVIANYDRDRLVQTPHYHRDHTIPKIRHHH